MRTNYILLRLETRKKEVLWVVKKFEPGGSPKGGWVVEDSFKIHVIFDNEESYVDFHQQLRERNRQREMKGDRQKEQFVLCEDLQVTTSEYRRWIDRAKQWGRLNKCK